MSDGPERRYAAAIAAAEKLLHTNEAMRFNTLLDAVVTSAFVMMVLVIFALSARDWVLLLARRKIARLRESQPVWLPEYAITEADPLRVFSLLALSLALVKELSGQAALDRADLGAGALTRLAGPMRVRVKSTVREGERPREP